MLKGVKGTFPKINDHHHPSSRKNDMEHLPSWPCQRRNPFHTLPQRMALNNILSRSLRWVELSSCKEPLMSAKLTHQKPFLSESLEKHENAKHPEWHYENAEWDQSSYVRVEERPRIQPCSPESQAKPISAAEIRRRWTGP